MSRALSTERWIPAALCLLGLVFFFQPELTSGFARMQWDYGDTRLHNFQLEHGYQWLISPFTTSLWNAPIFYPAENAFCFTDTMLGTLPIYAFWRILTLAPDSAMQAWMISLTLLNFASMLLLLRGALRFRPFPASAGAFLFAFGYSRAIQLGHPQLLQQFPMVIGVYAICRFFMDRKPIWAAAFFASWVVELYSSFYLGWFLLFSVGVAGVFAGKKRLASLRVHWRSILASGLVAAVCLLPLALHYLAAAKIAGLRPFHTTFQPRILSWLYLGRESPLYQWQDAIKSFRVLATFGPEQKLGLGFVTTALIFLGWSKIRSDGALRLVGLTAILLFLLTTEIIPGLRLWRVAYEVLPGAKALRALPRVSFVLLLPAAIGVAAFFSRKMNGVLAAGLFSILVLEQAHRGDSFDKAALAADVAALEQRIGKNCRAFFYSPRDSTSPAYKFQIDAMWASLHTGIPTLNGYSGTAPQDWDLSENRSITEADHVRLQGAVKEWSRVKKIDAVCWVE